MLWNCSTGEDFESPLDSKEIKPVNPKGNQPWVFIGRAGAETETPVLWSPHVKSWLIGKDCDAGRDWGQEEKGTTEGDKAGWHHRLNGHEFLWTPGVGDGQGDLVCCDSWSRKESDTTEQLNWTELMLDSFWIGNSNRCSNINNLIVTNLNHLQLRGIKYFLFICYHYFQFPHSVFQEIFKHKTSSQRQTRWQMSWWTWSKSLHGYIRNTPSDTEMHAEH